MRAVSGRKQGPKEYIDAEIKNGQLGKKKKKMVS